MRIPKKTQLLSWSILLNSAFIVPVFAQTPQALTKADYDHAVSKMSASLQSIMRESTVRTVWTTTGKLQYQLPGDKGFKLFDPQKKQTQAAVRQLPEYQPLRSNRIGKEVVAPDGKKAAFVRDWNLWVRDLATGKEKQLTFDGIRDFGYATDNAGWTHSDDAVVCWSPDSRLLASFRQDQRHVKDMYLVRTQVGAPELEAWKYPLPGDSAIIKIHRIIINTETGELIALKMGPDDHRGTLSDDITSSGAFDDNQWSADSRQLAFVSVSRDHKINTFRVADAQTGAVRTVFEEKVATQYESGQGAINWRFLPESGEVIWYSERDNWGHLYLYDLQTGRVRHQITRGNFVVTRLLRLDAAKRQLIFEAKGREPGENPYYRHYYRINFDGSKLIALTPESGDHTIQFSPDSLYFVDRYSTPVTPPVSCVRDINGRKLLDLGGTDIGPLKQAGWVAPHPFSVKSADDRFTLYGLMYQPEHMEAQRKYPVVVYIYPGPQGGSVGNWSFSAVSGDFQALAELGFIVVRLEGSGNPNRSKAFHDAPYGDLSVNTLPDQIAGLRQLAAKYGFLDLDRVGIWGHSGGGFATAAALLRYPDFFKVGVAQSGNHDNRNYEDDWGERYVGLLQGDNYQQQANQTYADNLKGKLLIAHGGMDNNVPPYGAYLLVDALIKANKDFDLLIFPNARHGYGRDNNYMVRRRWDYFVRHLMGATPPENYRIGGR